MLAAGTTFGPYKILGPLGAEGMGEVRQARGARPGPDSANETRLSGAATPTRHSTLRRSRTPAVAPRR